MRLLSLIHSVDAHSGIVAEAAADAGHELHERSLTLGRPPADPPESYDGVIVFGGAMNLHEEDDHPWIAEERDVVRRLLDEEVPLLGICLGGQLVASVAGSEVSRAPVPEIGWHEVELTPEAADDPLFGRLPPRFTAYQWHSYQFSLPPGAVALARSAVCLQGFRVGESAWGTQFHSEVTSRIVERWIENYGTDPDAVAQGFEPARAREELAANIGEWNRLGRDLCRAFFACAEERAGARARRVRV